MERHDRPPVATFFAVAEFTPGERVELSEGAAHHARVKRLVEGDRVRMTDGAGRCAFGAIATLGKKTASVEVELVDDIAPLRAIHLRVPVADRERMLWLAEKATELGIASWQAVRFRRSASVSPRGEGETFAERIRARMISALEQSGGSWLPAFVPDTSLETVAAERHGMPIVLDVGGASLNTLVGTGAGEPTILVGPEGGLEPDELTLLMESGWARASLARNVLRFETAGIAAVAAIRAAEMPTGD